MPQEDFIRVTYKGKGYRIPLQYINEDHPGGPSEIMDYADCDMTEAFIDAGHSSDAEATLETFLDGTAPETLAFLAKQKTSKKPGDATGGKAVGEADRWMKSQTLIAASVAVVAAGVTVALMLKSSRA